MTAPGTFLVPEQRGSPPVGSERNETKLCITSKTKTVPMALCHSRGSGQTAGQGQTLVEGVGHWRRHSAPFMEAGKGGSAGGRSRPGWP